jgi:hypothetical protein
MPSKKSPGREWLELKQRLVEYGIYERGQRKKLALYLQIGQSQLTCWLGRPKEPPYSAGKKIEYYLAAVPFIPFKPQTKVKDIGSIDCANRNS